MSALAIIGMGCAGLSLALAFAQKYKVIGFDSDEKTIAMYKQGLDPTCTAGEEAIKESGVIFTNDELDLVKANVYIIAVPAPDLAPLVAASKLAGRYIFRGNLVIYESTVEPGVTENICKPILEEVSGLKCGPDFKLGYSPERVSQEDKLVAACDAQALEQVAKLYEGIFPRVHRVSGIKVAEASKILESCQRDINTAFVNELAMIFDRMGIDTTEVMAAAHTKRDLQISGQFAMFLSNKVLRLLLKSDIKPKEAKIYILGATLKENCAVLHNSKVSEIYNELKSLGLNSKVADPLVTQEEGFELYGEDFTALTRVKDADCLIFAVAHSQFKQLTEKELQDMFSPSGAKILIDVKNIFDISRDSDKYVYWRL